MTLRGTGLWSFELRHHDPGEVAEAVAELESLGYSAVWIPDIGGDVFAPLENLLGATSTMTVATGILNVWMHTAAETSRWRAGLPDDQRERFLLGIGISHAPLIDPQPGMSWTKPLATTSAYLDGLDDGGVPVDARCIAALGPKMLELARDRSAGAHPYLVTPEHTAAARGILGDGLLAVEQGAVFETDPDTARGIARQALAGYVGLPNYVNNWKRFGFTDEDVEMLTDRLVDGLIAWGDVDTIAARVQEHRDAGANHVCVQILNEPGAPMNRTAWRELAPAVV
ncbi:MAG: F420-dependent oxidoreductase [Acidimicrobiales bacterium]|nr:F420-dependent oxidoreductase [Acidimicrobiales bacterium]